MAPSAGFHGPRSSWDRVDTSGAFFGFVCVSRELAQRVRNPNQDANYPARGLAEVSDEAAKMHARNIRARQVLVAGS